MLIFLGITICIVSIVALVLANIKISNQPIPFFSKWTAKNASIGVTLGIVLCISSGLFFMNKNGTATAIQYPWGGDALVTTQGLKLKLWGKLVPISFEIAMQDYLQPVDDNGNPIRVEKEEGIYYRPAQRKEFADAIKADIATSLIVEVDYSNEEAFLAMADKNGSESKLVHARIYPVYDQALKNTCKLMDAQDYISGASSQFDFYLKDQMEHGMYLTEEMYESIEETNITPTDSSKTVAKGKIKRRKRFRIRKDAKGEIIRDDSNSLKRYGLTVRQVAVTGIDWESSFDKRLQLQKEQVAQTQLEKQKAEKEYYATQKAIAQGEREKAETRVKFEKQQLEKTIAAETRAKEAKYKEQEEENLLRAAKKEAMRIKITADAEAYEIKQKVNAGITPEKRLQMELDASVERMKALAGPDGIRLPNTMFTTGGTNGKSNASVLESILSAKLLEGAQGGQ